MNTAHLIEVFIAATLLSVFYWQVFHFAILKRITFQLFALRDDCRRLAPELDSSQIKYLSEVERFVCKTIQIAPQICLVSFFSFCFRGKKTTDNSELEEDEFERNANKELISIRDSAAKNAVIIMAFNSPWALFGGSAAALLLIAFGKLSRAALYRGTEQFVEHVDDSSLSFAK